MQVGPKRYAPVLGPLLKVAFELRLPTEPSQEAKDLVLKLVQEGSAVRGDKVGQLFIQHYADSAVMGEKVFEGVPHRVLFPHPLLSITPPNPLAEESSLVFRRKHDNYTGAPRIWLLAAREGEATCFDSFSSFKASKTNQELVRLLFSSTTKKGFKGFTPIFLKAKHGDGYVYVKIEATCADSREVLIEVKKVAKEEAPKTLHNLISAH